MRDLNHTETMRDARLKTYHISLVLTIDGRNHNDVLRKVQAMIRLDLAEVIDHEIIAIDEIAKQ
jgi:hypothetical protein